MDTNKLNDASSSHFMDDDDLASKSKLSIKIKIPNTTTKEPDAAGDLNGIQAGHIVCEYCGKRFSSGKAWGGHKRHHLQMKKKNKEAKYKIIKNHNFKIKNRCATIFAGDVTVKDGKPACCLCHKIFPSMNSLFGHMKFHPGRPWKGTQPPPEEVKGPIGLEKIDLMSDLIGWLKKDRRGRISSPDLVPEAAYNLITLSRHGADHGSNPSSIFDSSSPMKKRKKKENIGEEMDGLESIEITSFDCDICKKKFATGQALGGHKRCHWKAQAAKPEVFESTEESNVASASSGEASSHHHKPNDGRLSIDLNKPYVVQDGEEDMPSFNFDDI